jgi:AcrR family transcriptional regulator
VVRSTDSGARERLTREERRARILDAAARVFAERAYESASIEEIAEAAGITKPVIYHHFSSKRALYIALLELYRGELLAFLGRRAATSHTPEERLRNGLDGFFEFVETHPHAWRILFHDPPPADEAIVQAHRQSEDRARAAIIALLAAAPTVEHASDPSGHELVVEREMAAEVIKTAADGLAAWWHDHPDVPREHLVYVLMSQLWVGGERFVSGERWGRGQA